MARGEIKERMALFQEEQEKRRRLSVLRSDALRKTAFIKRRAVVETHEVYHLIKWFFKEFLEQRREFTIGELRGELKSVYISSDVRKKLDDLLDRFEAIEYASVNYSHDDLMLMMEEFTAVVQHLVRMHTQKQSFWKKLKGFFFKEQLEPAVIIAELPVIEEDSPAHVRIATFVEKCYYELDRHNLKKAKVAYQQLLEEYGTLTTKQREEFYPLVAQTYQDILNRS